MLTIHFGVDNKTGPVAKSVQEFYAAVVSEFSSLSCISDALQKLFGFFGGDGGSPEFLRLAIQDDYGRFTNLQSQCICAIGMEQVKKCIHRIHAPEVIAMIGTSLDRFAG